MRNRIRIIIIALVVIGAAAGAYYFFVMRKTPSQDNPNTAQNQPVKKQPILVSQSNIISPALSSDQKSISYFTVSGGLFRLTLADGIAQGFPLPDRKKFPVTNPVKVDWQKNGNDFIIKQDIDGRAAYKLYKSDSNSYLDYPAQMRSPRFLSNDKTIIYDWVTPSDKQFPQGKHELSTAMDDTTAFRKITDLDPATYEIEPNGSNSTIALFSGVESDNSKLTVLDINTVMFTDLGQAAAYEGVKFSLLGGQLLAARSTGIPDTLPSLSVFNLTTKEEKDLQISANIESTIWESDKNVIVGTPTGFTRIDSQTGAATEFYTFDQSGSYSPTSLVLTSDGNILFFVNADNGSLYKLDLK